MSKPSSLFRVIIFFLFPLFLSAAEKSVSYRIDWMPAYEKKFSAEETFRSLNFSGASFDENYMPQFVVTQPLSSFATKINVQLNNIVVEPLTDISLIRNQQSIGFDFKIVSEVVTRKKKPIAAISILPVRKNSAGGFERLISFDIDIQPVFGAARLSSTHSFATSSVLAQ